VINYIPIDKCINRKLYRIKSRNLTLGVFDSRTNGFFGLREKFDRIFVFEEHHYDNGVPYGTVFPIEELVDELPANIQLVVILGQVCVNCKKKVDYVKWPEGGEREKILSDGSVLKVPGQWEHIEESDCQNVIAVTSYNSELKDWLHTMSAKYE
jgi:hypothetical protein